MSTITTDVPEFSVIPFSGDATFYSDVDTFMGEIPAFGIAVNSVADEMNTVTGEVNTNATNASTSATNALASENKAEEWAEKAEDAEVETGQYSAKHHAIKAAASAAAALLSETDAETALTNFESQYTSSSTEPVSPSEGMLWFDETSNTLKVYSGTEWLIYSAGGIASVREDSSPQLGGDLDTNSFDIIGTGNIALSSGSTIAAGSTFALMDDDFASEAEAVAGTSTTTVISPATLHSVLTPYAYGLKYDKTTDTITSGILQSNGIFIRNSFTEIPIQEQMGRGLLTNTEEWTKLLSTNTTKLSSSGATATLDGTAGQVMVRIPSFHQIVVNFDDGIQYFLVSTEPFTLKHSTYTPVSSWIPWGFRDELFRYIGAYQSTALTDSTTAQAMSIVRDGAGTNYNPFTNRTRAQFRTQTRDGCFHQWDYGLYEIVRMLFYTEFKTFDSQTALRGNTDRGSWDYSYTTKSGSTNAYGDDSHASPDGLSANSFRGIENIFGNVWQLVDGVNINGTDSGRVYVCNTPSNFADDTATNYTDSGFAPNFDDVDNYQKYIYATGKYCPFWCSELGGDSSSYITDYMWNQETAGWRVVLVGGALHDGDRAGVGLLDAYNGASNVHVSIGSRSAA
ncbi:MAG: hypothetical protein HQK65_04560 [Desulfamplus sp.]|nr:hypothetical protein [Desulfamplus sp.]